MEERLKRRLLRALDGELAPDEELLVSSNGMHPKLAAGGGTFAAIVIGALAGSALQSATGVGPEQMTPFLGAVLALVGRWVYVFRTSSGQQLAGALPLIGLTGERLMLVETDFWGRTRGTRHDFPLASIAAVTVNKRLLGLPDTTIQLDDERIVRYQVRYADRIKTEIERLKGGQREAGSG